jgi:hypothetical protein
MGIKQLPLPPEAGRILKQGGFFDAESIIHLLRSPREDVTAGMLYLTLRSWQSVYPMCITEMFFNRNRPANPNSDEFARAEPKFCPRNKLTSFAIVVCPV